MSSFNVFQCSAASQGVHQRTFRLDVVTWYYCVEIIDDGSYETLEIKLDKHVLHIYLTSRNVEGTDRRFTGKWVFTKKPKLHYSLISSNMPLVYIGLKSK